MATNKLNVSDDFTEFSVLSKAVTVKEAARLRRMSANLFAFSSFTL